MAEIQFYGHTPQAGTTTEADGTLLIVGTEGSDTISAGASPGKAVLIFTLGGDDSVNVQDNQQNYTAGDLAPVSIFAGDGNDTFFENLVTDGGGDYSTASVYISAGDGNDTFHLEGSSENVTAIAGDGNDTFTTDIYGTGSMGATLVAGNGNDSFSTGTVGAAGSQSVSITAGYGRDHIFNSDPDDFDSVTFGGVPIFVDWQQQYISGKIYTDTNHDGKYEAGEPAVANAVVTYENSYTGTVSTLSDAHGNYSFNIPSPDGGAGQQQTIIGPYLLALTPGDYYGGLNLIASSTPPSPGAVLTADGLLIVTGTANADNIHIAVAALKLGEGAQTITATVNGSSQVFSSTQIKAIVVNAGDGNDTINVDGPYDSSAYGYHGLATTVNGGAGNDQITTAVYDVYGVYTSPHDYISGDAGNDVITVNQDGLSTVHGGAGDDVINSKSVDGLTLYAYGDEGNDTINGDRYTTDIIDGGIGNNTFNDASAYVSGSAIIDLNSFYIKNIQNYTNYGSVADLTVIGTDQADHISVTFGTNVSIQGNGGDDVISVEALHTTIDGGSGNDYIFIRADGTGGGATITGGTGNDTIDAGLGDDPVNIDGGADTDTAYTQLGDTVTNVEILNPTHTKLSGTLIGTAGSYRNHGTTIANAFDGNLSTFFDGPDATGDWVGLDLGAVKVITQVRYAPRAGWESRMVGGQFQASNTADFSSGVVTLATITSAPASSTITTQALPAGAAYRYYRYIGPTNSYCDIAELEFDA